MTQTCVQFINFTHVPSFSRRKLCYVTPCMSNLVTFCADFRKFCDRIYVKMSVIKPLDAAFTCSLFKANVRPFAKHSRICETMRPITLDRQLDLIICAPMDYIER